MRPHLRPLSLCFALITASGCGVETPAAEASTDASPSALTDASPLDDATPAAAPARVAAVAPAALSSVIGTWHLRVAGARFTATFAWNSDDARLEGSLSRESTPAAVAASPPAPLLFDGWSDDGALRFRQTTSESTADWYRVRVVEGVMTGRVARVGKLRTEPDATAYDAHVTGWNRTWIDRELAPRAWDVVLDGERRATLRIDRAVGALTEYVGTLKVYASVDGGVADEELEHDLGVLGWDGTHLEFYLMEGDDRRYFNVEVSGRSIAGTWLEATSDVEHTLTGVRADVLGYGLSARAPESLAAWQSRTRRQVAHLVMADAPTPRSVRATVVAPDLAPIPQGVAWAARDDDPAQHPQAYRLSELRLTYTLPDPYGGAPLTRQVHAYLARPTAPAPAGGRPVAVAVNGHWGSALQVMTPNSPYWYGDAFARRGYLVIAVDASHRPFVDRSARYTDMLAGDDAPGGNGPHPAIRSPGMDSDWEEDGERAWDVMRAVDYVTSLPDADASRVVAVGLSMGGEVVTLAGALDARVSAVVSTGFSPDVAVFRYRHHPCWDWAWADVNEYIDVSDYHALVAPRALVVETGRRDTTFSILREPFASDKQVLRRSRAAFADAPSRVLHYLHYDAHNFHVGSLGATTPAELGVRVPLAIEPEAPWSMAWQGDEVTREVSPTLFDTLDTLLR
ncbi:MAG: acetylxylan esterase [Polyangiales bacterium]